MNRMKMLMMCAALAAAMGAAAFAQGTGQDEASPGAPGQPGAPPGQPGPDGGGRGPGPETVSVSGVLGAAKGLIALTAEDGKVYYVPGLSRLAGFVDGLKEGAQASVEGYAAALPGDGFLLRVTRLTLNGKDYDMSSLGMGGERGGPGSAPPPPPGQGNGPRQGRGPGQPGQGPRGRGPETVSVSGVLGVAKDMIALTAEDSKVYYVPGLSRFTGFIDGLKEGAKVTAEGYAEPVPGDGFMLRLTRLTLNGKDYDMSSLPGWQDAGPARGGPGGRMEGGPPMGPPPNDNRGGASRNRGNQNWR